MTDRSPSSNGTADTAELTLEVRTANRDRKAEIGVEPTVTVQEILDAARENWALPGDYDYVVRCERLGRQLSPGVTLASAGLIPGDVLEIQPIADAGVTELLPVRPALDDVAKMAFRWWSHFGRGGTKGLSPRVRPVSYRHRSILAANGADTRRCGALVSPLPNRASRQRHIPGTAS